MKLKKYLCNVDLSFKKIIIFAILSSIYTAIMALVPCFKDTSFIDITISFEVWILFGIFIIMNSKSAKDSAIKCFVFFLISQPLVYLLQVPFSNLGFGIFSYYKRWFIWTLFTIVMGYFGYYMKKDKWWGLVILFPILIFLGVHYGNFLKETLFMFPHHLLSTLFCFITLLFYPYYIFKKKKNITIGIVISSIIIIVMSVISLSNRIIYNTDILVSNEDFIFDDSYDVYLEDTSFGDVVIIQDDMYYVVNANFKKGGKTNLILVDDDNNKTIFEINVYYNSYDIVKK